MQIKGQNDLTKILAKIKGAIENKFSAREMQKIGEFVAAEIRERSRRGYGVSRLGGPEEQFEPLSERYIAQRRRMKLSPFTSPTRSNITRSGRLLAGLRYTTAKNRVRIVPTGKSREGVSNADIAYYLTEQGRPFLTLSKCQLGRLVESINKRISDIR